MAIVALVERRCVKEKRWIEQEEFLHGIAFGQILGPFSLNITTFVGYYLRGIPGGIVAATSFIAPSFLLVSLLGFLYFRFHHLPQLNSALAGSNPVVIALVLVAGIGMARHRGRTLENGLLMGAAFAAAAFFQLGALSILVAAGCWGLFKGWRAGRVRS